TGGLFACPLTPELSDCWRVPIDEGVDLQRESKENQWLGVSVKSQGAGGKIVDLRVRDEMDGGGWKFCEGRPQSHEHFGTCQQGLAAAFSPDRRYVLLGAPGTYNWKGLLFVTNIESTAPDQRVFRTPQPGERVPGAAADVAHNSYLGSCV
ncbi:ITA7 protein, partial [Neodrepanis coruscans]|nr:ITA7 protein [Neodrepanis coruscans]